MELKRKAYEKLVAWKNRRNHKPLIVEGLRQVGKSFLVNKFAHENYENVIVFDFRNRKELRKCFQFNLDVDSILSSAEPYFPNQSFVPGKTVLVFEEINDCEAARASLKPFAIDGRFDVIATGSALGAIHFRRKSKDPLPTGSEEFLKITPLDFEEFLWASKTPQEAIELLKKASRGETKLAEALQDYFQKALQRYIVVGGLPEVVTRFFESNLSLLEARKKQEELLLDYRGDFGRFIADSGKEEIDYRLQAMINASFDAISGNLSRENGNYKFRFGDIRHGARASEFYAPMEWLEKAGLIYRVFNVKTIESPLSANKCLDCYKVFYGDMGLLLASFPLSTTQDFLSGSLGSRKGAIYENLAAIFLAQNDFSLFYFGKAQEHLEIDFLLEGKDGITLLEEKSTNGRMAASKAIMEKKSPYQAVSCLKVMEQGFGQGSFYRSIPQYALPFYLESEQARLQEGLLAEPLPELDLQKLI